MDKNFLLFFIFYRIASHQIPCLFCSFVFVLFCFVFILILKTVFELMVVARKILKITGMLRSQLAADGL